MLDVFSVQGSAELPWCEREKKAFFRGRDSNLNRLELVRISKKNPDLVNAGITAYFFFPDEGKELGTVDYVSLYKYFDYRYEISIDGTVAAYRVPYLLSGGSLLFKMSTPYFEHYFRHLRAGEHFVDVKDGLSDLTEKIKWAKENDEEAK